MQRWNIHYWLLAALLMMPCISLAAEGTPSGPGKSAVTMPAELATAMTEYRLKLKEYKRARQEYDDQAAAYWNSVAEKRRARNAKRSANEEIVLTDYVLTQPPVYTGPPEPVNPEKGVPEPPPQRKYIPVVADFLRAAKEQFDFTPQMPKSEIEFKRAYAKVAAAVGLSPAAVSLALRGKPGVSEATRARVVEAARLLGYRPVAGASRQHQKPMTIGLVIKAVHGDSPEANRFYAPVMAGI